MDLWETGRHNLEICVLHSVIHEPERFCTARATVSVQRATMLRSMKKHLMWNYSDCVDIYFGIIPCLVTCVAKLSRDKVKPVYTDQQVHDVPPPFRQVSSEHEYLPLHYKYHSVVMIQPHRPRTTFAERYALSAHSYRRFGSFLSISLI